MAAPELIPLATLLGNPEKAQPGISPDGERTSYLAPVDGVLNVWVGTAGADDHRPVTNDTDRGIRAHAWAHDNRHLTYIQDKGGDENWHLYAVDLDEGEERDLTPFDGIQARLVGFEKRRPDELLVGLNRDDERLHDVYHLDLSTGELDKVAPNPGFIGWVADSELRVRGAIRTREDAGREVLVRDTADAEWRIAASFDPDDAEMSGPIAFTLDGNALYLTSAEGANAARLVRLNLRDRTTEVLAGDPRYDVIGVTRHPDTREPQMVTFLKDRIEHLVLDPAIADDVETIGGIDDGDFGIVGRTHADDRWLVSFTKDDGGSQSYLFDRRIKEATFLFDARPELRRYTLAKMEPFSFRARDGLEVHGYISFPPGATRHDLPAVLTVHGGPWSRDTWGFHPYAQWFANRGYACIQVNYRGSIGYGKDFLNAGDREWAAKMHDDLIDAVEWAIAKGYVDRERIAIFGGSYGGYAALVGATFTPEVFRCAVSIVGPSNLKTLLETIPPYWQPNIARFHRRVGHPERDEAFLWSRSPLSKVENIKIPLMIGHGANDPRVKLSETQQIVDAMKARGIEHELMVFDDEGHGFAKPENRLRFCRAADRFLATHLGGRAE